MTFRVHYSGQPAVAAVSTDGLLIDYAEFLLWVDRNCLENVADRGLLILRSVLETRVQENVDVAGIFKKAASNNQVINENVFCELMTSLGLLYCRTSMGLIFETVVDEGASAIDVLRLTQLLVVPYASSHSMVRDTFPLN